MKLPLCGAEILLPFSSSAGLNRARRLSRLQAVLSRTDTPLEPVTVQLVTLPVGSTSRRKRTVPACSARSAAGRIVVVRHPAPVRRTARGELLRDPRRSRRRRRRSRLRRRSRRCDRRRRRNDRRGRNRRGLGRHLNCGRRHDDLGRRRRHRVSGGGGGGGTSSGGGGGSSTSNVFSFSACFLIY